MALLAVTSHIAHMDANIATTVIPISTVAAQPRLRSLDRIASVPMMVGLDASQVPPRNLLRMREHWAACMARQHPQVLFAARPRPVLQPMRALTIWIPTISGYVNNQLFCFANASRTCFSCLQFGAYLSAWSYLASASFVLPRFASTSPHAFSGSAHCGPRLLESASFASALARSPCIASARPQE
jgi:hypothetical protein